METKYPAEKGASSLHRPSGYLKSYAVWELGEIERFGIALKLFGRNYQKMSSYIETKDYDQVRQFAYRVLREINEVLSGSGGQSLQKEQMQKGILLFFDLKRQFKLALNAPASKVLSAEDFQRFQQKLTSSVLSCSEAEKKTSDTDGPSSVEEQLKQSDCSTHPKEVPNTSMTPLPKRFTLQLVPKNETVMQEVAAAGYNPMLQLTYPSKRPISFIIRHITKKWVRFAHGKERCIASKPIRLYPPEAPQHEGWGSDQPDVPSASVYRYLGCPRIMRLCYDWGVKSCEPAPPSTVQSTAFHVALGPNNSSQPASTSSRPAQNSATSTINSATTATSLQQLPFPASILTHLPAIPSGTAPLLATTSMNILPQSLLLSLNNASSLFPFFQQSLPTHSQLQPKDLRSKIALSTKPTVSSTATTRTSAPDASVSSSAVTKNSSKPTEQLPSNLQSSSLVHVDSDILSATEVAENSEPSNKSRGGNVIPTFTLDDFTVVKHDNSPSTLPKLASSPQSNHHSALAPKSPSPRVQAVFDHNHNNSAFKRVAPSSPSSPDLFERSLTFPPFVSLLTPPHPNIRPIATPLHGNSIGGGSSNLRDRFLGTRTPETPSLLLFEASRDTFPLADEVEAQECQAYYNGFNDSNSGFPFEKLFRKEEEPSLDDSCSTASQKSICRRLRFDDTPSKPTATTISTSFSPPTKRRRRDHDPKEPQTLFDSPTSISAAPSDAANDTNRKLSPRISSDRNSLGSSTIRDFSLLLNPNSNLGLGLTEDSSDGFGNSNLLGSAFANVLESTDTSQQQPPSSLHNLLQPDTPKVKVVRSLDSLLEETNSNSCFPWLN
ncbi:TSL-kinase interacting protein [Balamuthia mandrillaris]